MNNHRYFYSVFLIISLFIYAGVAIGAAPVPASFQNRLVASDAASGANFGWSVAIDGDTVVISASDDSNDKGAAYVYERADSGWEQVSRLTASDGEVQDTLGISVAISGDTVVLGAAVEDNAAGTDAGAVYIYVKPSGGWGAAMSETYKLLAPGGGMADRGFGGSVALKGNTLVVGAPGKSALSSPGEVFVFEGAGSSWSPKAVLSVSGLNGSDAYGSMLGFDGNTIVVGAFGQDSSKGAVYVYHKPVDGWSNKSHDAMLVADDGASSDFFGGGVAVDGDTILVGANGDDDDGSKSGSAYLFTRSNNVWGEMPLKLTSDDGKTGDNFGYSVGLAGNTAVVGASHFRDNASDSVYIFTGSGSNWTQREKLSGPGGSKFGLSVAVDGQATTLLVGASGEDAAYVYGADAVDLALIIQDDTDPVRVGEQVTYTLTVTNNGIDIDATGVTVTNTLPAGLSYVSDNNGVSGCSQTGQEVSCNLGTVWQKGGTNSVAITVQADSAGIVTNRATVSANEFDANSSDNEDSEETTITSSSGGGNGGNGGSGGGALNLWLLLLFAGLCQLVTGRRYLLQRQGR